MTYTIIGPHHEETTLALLRAEYPDLVAYDESGWELDLEDLGAGSDCGPSILFWASAGDADAAAAGDGYGNCVAQGDRR